MANKASFSCVELGQRGSDGFLLFGQMQTTRFGNAEQALGAVGGLGFDQPCFFHRRDGRVDDAGARCIGAGGAGVEFADQVVAVACLRLDQVQQDQRQFGAAEYPLAARIATPAFRAALATPAVRTVSMVVMMMVAMLALG